MTRPSDPRPSPRASRGAAAAWALVAFAAIALFFALTEHRAHLFGALPFVLLGLMVVMHLLHRGHGGHEPDEPADDAKARPRAG